MKNAIWMGCTLFVGLVGCAQDVAVSERRNAIINGEASGPDDDSTIAIALTTKSGQFQGLCSGVLVAPTLVMTARHCVSKVQPGAIACDEDGAPIKGGDVIADYPPAQLEIYVGTSGNP